jgi:hypothetical protein
LEFIGLNGSAEANATHTGLVSGLFAHQGIFKHYTALGWDAQLAGRDGIGIGVGFATVYIILAHHYIEIAAQVEVVDDVANGIIARASA